MNRPVRRAFLIVHGAMTRNAAAAHAARCATDGRGRISSHASAASQSGSNNRLGRTCIAAPASTPLTTQVPRLPDA
jgi:hypothetical protein